MPPPHPDPAGQLAAWVADGDVAVLSGAGLSTESGIPDYRGPTGSSRRGTPMTYQTFTADPDARRRYWARSFLGWQTIAAARPNAGHVAVAALRARGLLTGIITQNVDGLHQAAGVDAVIELHGSLARTVCLGCADRRPRAELQHRLAAANPGFRPRVESLHADGDVELAAEDIDGFAVPGCVACAGVLKPDVVFFGETVPPRRVQAAFDLVARARTLLVLGSSLTVMSGRRFVVHAAKLGIRVAIVNQGPTRGDPYAGLILDAALGVALPDLARRAGAAATAG